MRQDILNRIKDILEKNESNDQKAIEIYSLFYNSEEDSIDLDKVILVGHLNKVFGYEGYKPVEIGTPVYETKDRYYFEIETLNGKIKNIQKFYKEDLYKCINFI